jgi:hypothetical protein
MTCLIQFVNETLDFWLRLSQKLEERGDPWEESPTQLLSCFDVRRFSRCEVSAVMSVPIT